MQDVEHVLELLPAYALGSLMKTTPNWLSHISVDARYA